MVLTSNIIGTVHFLQSLVHDKCVATGDDYILNVLAKFFTLFMYLVDVSSEHASFYVYVFSVCGIVCFLNSNLSGQIPCVC